MCGCVGALGGREGEWESEGGRESRKGRERYISLSS